MRVETFAEMAVTLKYYALSTAPLMSWGFIQSYQIMDLEKNNTYQQKLTACLSRKINIVINSTVSVLEDQLNVPVVNAVAQCLLNIDLITL